MQPGRALCIWNDAGWGSMVREGKYRDGRFADELLDACVELVREWRPLPAPTWVTVIPSHRRPHLMGDFAQRLAAELHLPFRNALERTEQAPPQKTMANAHQRARNVTDSLVADRGVILAAPVLLVDDLVDSRWTFTVAAFKLRHAGCGPVWPLALADTRGTR
jgi:ATP-dependent DNA helicase RecQ